MIMRRLAFFLAFVFRLESLSFFFFYFSSFSLFFFLFFFFFLFSFVILTCVSRSSKFVASRILGWRFLDQCALLDVYTKPNKEMRDSPVDENVEGKCLLEWASQITCMMDRAILAPNSSVLLPRPKLGVTERILS